MAYPSAMAHYQIEPACKDTILAADNQLVGGPDLEFGNPATHEDAANYRPGWPAQQLYRLD